MRSRLFEDTHVGITRWREKWHTWRYHTSHRYRRCKGVWDALLERHVLMLHDGRRLTYFLDGAGASATGGSHPVVGQELPHVFVFHAMFLSGNSFLMSEAPVDYTLVCVNRPGYYGSDSVVPNDNYSFDTFADDIRQLADHLRVSTFSVAGHSSGGPCALACAARLPRRVVSVGLLASDPEYAHPDIPSKRHINALCLGYILPWLLRYILWWMVPFLGARQAVDGMETDYRLETSVYPFTTESIRQATLVYLGEHDQVMPLAVTQHVHERLTNLRQLRIVANVGHLGLLRDAVLSDFLETLVNMAVEEEAKTSTCSPENGEKDEGRVEVNWNDKE